MPLAVDDLYHRPEDSAYGAACQDLQAFLLRHPYMTPATTWREGAVRNSRAPAGEYCTVTMDGLDGRRLWFSVAEFGLALDSPFQRITRELVADAITGFTENDVAEQFGADARFVIAYGAHFGLVVEQAEAGNFIIIAR